MLGRGVKHAVVSTDQAVHRQVIEHIGHAVGAMDTFESTIKPLSEYSSTHKQAKKASSAAVEQADRAIHHLTQAEELGGVSAAAHSALEEARHAVLNARSEAEGWNYSFNIGYHQDDALGHIRTALAKSAKASEAAADQTGFINAQLKKMDDELGLDLGDDFSIQGEDLL